jgi:hypothetical protein
MERGRNSCRNGSEVKMPGGRNETSKAGGKECIRSTQADINAPKTTND